MKTLRPETTTNPFAPGDILELLPLSDNLAPALVLGLLLCLFFVFVFGRGPLRSTRRGPASYPPKAQPFTPARPGSMADPRNQMEAISRVAFETRPLLNNEVARLLPLLEDLVRRHGRGHRLMAQTSLGELIRPRQGSAGTTALKNAYASINSKRLDFAIVDQAGRLVCAIEYQGSGHYHETTFMRDAVKREAIRKAGVPFVEIAHDYNADDLGRQVRNALRPAAPASSPVSRAARPV